MRLLCRKYHFLENSKNRILVKKFFLAKQKDKCLFIVDKEPKKNYLVQICDIDCQSNMEWPIYFDEFKYIRFKQIWFLIQKNFLFKLSKLFVLMKHVNIYHKLKSNKSFDNWNKKFISFNNMHLNFFFRRNSLLN